MIQKVHTSLSEIKEYMNTILPIQESFDLVERSIWVGGKEGVFYFVDGLLKDESMVKIMTAFFAVRSRICRRMRKRSQKNVYRVWRLTLSQILRRS